VHNVSDVRQIAVHTAEPLVPGPSRLEVEIDIAELKNYKLQGIDRPPLWSSGQSSWLQIRRPGFDSRHYQKKKM
jgi:hypothetical protein